VEAAGEPGDIGAGAEGAVSGSGQDDGPDTRVRFQRIEGLRERVDQRVVERVQLGRPVQGEKPDSIADFHEKCGHAPWLSPDGRAGHPRRRRRGLHGCRTSVLESAGMPDWDGLRIFLAVGRGHTLSGAARKLGVDETTVARRVARLEKEMGSPLLERAPGGLVLTAAGQAVFEAAGEMERAALTAGRRALGADRQLSGRVRITAPEILGSHFVLPALQAVHRRHPGIAIEVISTIARLDVTRREADVAIRTIRPVEPSLVTRKLGRMAIAPYVRRRRGRLGAPAAASYADGVRLPIRDIERRLEEGSVALRTNSIAPVLAAVRLGWGAGDLPCFLGDATPGLERAFPGEAPDAMDVWLIVHADLQRTARVRVIVEELVRAFRDGAQLLGAAYEPVRAAQE